jgi:hypothetical protein
MLFASGSSGQVAFEHHPEVYGPVAQIAGDRGERNERLTCHAFSVLLLRVQH